MTRKNISISISEELHRLIKKHEYINWSGYCRLAIELLVERLENDNPIKDTRKRLSEMLEK